MSCDYAVWYPWNRISSRAACRLYVALCKGDNELQPHPAVDAFYDELTTLHPQIDDWNDEGKVDNSPWSAEFDRSPSYVIVSAVWSQADYVGNLVESLARKHGLAFFDPQSERIVYP